MKVVDMIYVVDGVSLHVKLVLENCYLFFLIQSHYIVRCDCCDWYGAGNEIVILESGYGK